MSPDDLCRCAHPRWQHGAVSKFREENDPTVPDRVRRDVCTKPECDCESFCLPPLLIKPEVQTPPLDTRLTVLR